MDFVHVVGARPNIPKLAPVFNAIAKHGCTQFVVHTGQHFDPALSGVLFEQLGLPPEDANLGVGSGTHAQQTAAVMEKIENLFLEVEPKMVIVYGDVNSTVAAALVASKMGIPVAHVEAGLRSRDRSMPEEINRLVTDVLCDIALTTSVDANENLIAEGRDPESIHFVGNPMIDSLRAVEKSLPESIFANEFGPQNYGVVTLHRPANVDLQENRTKIVDILLECSKLTHLVFPVHPRRKDEFENSPLGKSQNITLTGPLPYMEFLSAIKASAVTITDSGGVQEETTAFGVPCLTLRPNTERPVTIEKGTNDLVTLDNVVDRLREALNHKNDEGRLIPELWDGKAGPRIAKVLVQNLDS